MAKQDDLAVGKEQDYQEPINIAEPKLRLMDGISVIFGLMVGSGIFSSAGLIYADVGSSGMSLLVWLATGLLALTGALCYAELGTMIPGSGGEALYLERGLGPWSTFVFNWASVLLLKPGSDAIIAVAFAKYVMMLFLVGRRFDPLADDGNAILRSYKWPVKGIALGCCIAVTVLSGLSKSISRQSQLTLTVLKLGTLAFVIGAGFISLFINSDMGKENLGQPFVGTAASIPLYASAFNHGLWAFEGWNNLNLVAGDLRRPARTLPLAIWAAVSMVISLYLLTLLGYFFVLPGTLIAQSETIGVALGWALFGRAGAILMALLIAICIFGACLSGMATSAEVVVLAGRVGHMPGLFGRINKTLGTAINAYAMQCVLAMALVLASDFDLLVHIYTFPAWLFYGGCVTSLVILRWREPGLPRPYRVWPTTPVLFLVACVLLIGTSAWAQPVAIGAAFGLLLLALPAYFFLIREGAPCRISSRRSTMEMVERPEEGPPPKDAEEESLKKDTAADHPN